MKETVRGALKMSLLQGFQVVQIGEGLAAAVCGRLFADAGADVSCIEPDMSTHLSAYLNHGKKILSDETAAIRTALAKSNLIICEADHKIFALCNTTPTIFAG